jgi:hypothetical protein
MKKIIAILVALIAGLCLSANAAYMPSWVENLTAGQSYAYGEYSVSKGIAEGVFTPTTFTSSLDFGDGETGGYIDQAASTSITGTQVGSVDRQLFAQAGSAYVAYNDLMDYWDPENPNTAMVAQMGITKNQFAAFSGALKADEPTTTDTFDINGDGINDDHFTGGHVVTILVAGDDPSWTATFSDEAETYAPTAELHQEVTDASVTISADAAGVVDDSIYLLQDPDCDGYQQIWKGYASGVIDPDTGYYDNGEFIMAGATVDDLIDLAGDYSKNTQLTELGATMDSDVNLVQTVANNANGPVLITSLNGAASLGAEFQNAFLDPGVTLNIDMSSVNPSNPNSKFQYWWEKPV